MRANSVAALLFRDLLAVDPVVVSGSLIVGLVVLGLFGLAFVPLVSRRKAKVAGTSGTSSASASRARGNRLVILFAVTFVFVIGAMVWSRYVKTTASDKRDAVEVELRTKFAALDLPAVADRYNTETINGTAANDLALLPSASGATWVSATGFTPSGVDALYRIETIGDAECVTVHARRVAGKPNAVTFATAHCR